MNINELVRKHFKINKIDKQLKKLLENRDKKEM